MLRSSAGLRDHDLMEGTCLGCPGSGGHAYRLKHWVEAQENYDKSIGLNPSNGMAFARRGECHFRRDHLDKALGDLDQAVRLMLNTPDSASGVTASAASDLSYAYTMRGRCRFNQAQLKQAQADLSQAAADLLQGVFPLDPLNVKAFVYLAQYHKKMGAWDKALQALNEAI